MIVFFLLFCFVCARLLRAPTALVMEKCVASVPHMRRVFRSCHDACP